MYIYLFYFVENGSKKLVFRKLKGTQGNLGFFKGSARRSNGRKNLQREKNSGKIRKKLRKLQKKTQEMA